MTQPTFPQIEYAEALVERLRADNNIKADYYARQVYNCMERSGLSQLINEMKALLDEVEEKGHWLR